MPNNPFVHREKSFYELFEKSSENMMKAALRLQVMLNNCDMAEGLADITELEHQGDSVTHEIMALLHSTFVTPFDREDIGRLAHTVDDITDFIHSVAEDMVIYRIDHPTERARELAEIIVRAASTVDKALHLMPERSETQNLLNCCIEMNRYENAADSIYRSAKGELFDQQTQPTDIIKWRKIYEDLETATDRCEDVADVLEGIVIKQS